jgi:hypothetical protein
MMESKLKFQQDNGLILCCIIYSIIHSTFCSIPAGSEQPHSTNPLLEFLIYIDPPKADYHTKVALPGIELEQMLSVIEQLAMP